MKCTIKQLAEELELSRNTVSKALKNSSEVSSKTKQTVLSKARELGYVETLFGRRRYLPDIKAKNFNRRSFAERTAINTPIQGTAADIIKIAMLKVAENLRQAQVKSRVLLQVHDELVLEVTEKEKDQVARIVKDTMEHAVELAVPLVADVAVGKNWAQAK